MGTVIHTGSVLRAQIVRGSVGQKPNRYQSKYVVPADVMQIVRPDAGYTALSSVTVEAKGEGSATTTDHEYIESSGTLTINEVIDDGV